MATKKKTTGPNPNPEIDVHTTKDSRGDHRFTIDDQDGFTYAYPPRSFDTEKDAREAGDFVMDYRANQVRDKLNKQINDLGEQANLAAARHTQASDDLNERLTAAHGRIDELTKKLADVPGGSFWSKALMILIGVGLGLAVYHWLIA